MSYEDHIKTLLEEIRREREQDDNIARIEAPVFDSPTALLSFLRNRPVARHVEVTTLPSFLRRFRSSLGLTIQNAADALGIELRELNELESINCLPWTIPAISIARILSGYRIHIEAAKFLAQNSYEIARVSGRLSNSNDVMQKISTWVAALRAELEKQNEIDLLT